MDKKLIEELRSITPTEEKQRIDRRYIFDYPADSVFLQEHEMIFSEDFFLKNSSVFINRHNRFAPCPEHKHKFLEMNYVLSGKSMQCINGAEETIHQGEILLLDKNSSHSLDILGENDLLINIIFTNEKMDLAWLSSIHKESNMLFSILAKDFINISKKQYIIFRCGENRHVQSILELMMEKYFSKALLAEESVFLYIPLLITELISSGSFDFHRDDERNFEKHQVISDVIRLIEQRYTTITLDAAARELGFNKNYLCNLVKKKTNYNFTELLTLKRMKQAKYLLQNTNLPICKIVEIIGLQNKNHFYKQFRKYNGASPRDFRDERSLRTCR
jgi:AraC-like DNA-binding protein/uncharacterized cupin superfamily protein